MSSKKNIKTSILDIVFPNMNASPTLNATVVDRVKISRLPDQQLCSIASVYGILRPSNTLLRSHRDTNLESIFQPSPEITLETFRKLSRKLEDEKLMQILRTT